MNTGDLRQGDIVKVNFNPTHGHEQKGFRPVLIVSNHLVQKNSNIWLCCPISHTKRDFPLYVDIPDYLKTDGKILLDQIRSLDLSDRGCEYVESLREADLQDILAYIKLIFESER
ncbi:type II toxin-antitoxin system PemK/MazF family toxin [Companilactobacillus sp. HBUAS59699]|uniref:type II toxin-antitoxin system PemK/MazF family toxin n=1 Tax=Companilactobacillus sp. HBUAS59699 TaxID=3109358 RepID=UPI002FF0F89F